MIKLWPPNFWNEKYVINMQCKKRPPSPKMVLEKFNIHLQENEIRFMSFTLYKNHLKVDQIPEFKTWNAENSRGKHETYFKIMFEATIIWSELQELAYGTTWN